MVNEQSEVFQYGLLRSALRNDLVSLHGFSNPDAGQILNWFDPTNSEYLEHVDSWQKLLCAGAVVDRPAPFSFIRRNAFGSYDLEGTSPDVVRCVHQIAKILYKYHGVPRRETKFSEVKHRLHNPGHVSLDSWELDRIRKHLSGVREPDLNYLCGRFGPGATYEGFNAYEKWRRLGAIPDVPPNLYRVNPRDPWVAQSVSPDFAFTKIAEVPKSIKSNRIVSSESAMRMYAQLAVNDFLVKEISREFAGHVSLHDQEQHNRLLYEHGSCTLDLSDASDHVSSELVTAVLPQLWPVLAKVRSTHAMFPDGDMVQLRTFAPMGSGVCFSVMTTVILGIAAYSAEIASRERGGRTAYSVYGDDIICTVNMYDIMTDLLTRAGLVINRTKSCCSLNYVESCGLELYKGVNITPAYIRDPIDILCADKVEQVATLLEQRAFPATARVIADRANCARFFRVNKHLQRREVCVRTLSARQKIRALTGWDGLNRWFSVNTMGNTIGDKRATGAVVEVWTKPSWRCKPEQDYPYLAHWLVTRAQD